MIKVYLILTTLLLGVIGCTHSVNKQQHLTSWRLEGDCYVSNNKHKVIYKIIWQHNSNKDIILVLNSLGIIVAKLQSSGSKRLCIYSQQSKCVANFNELLNLSKPVDKLTDLLYLPNHFLEIKSFNKKIVYDKMLYTKYIYSKQTLKITLFIRKFLPN